MQEYEVKILEIEQKSLFKKLEFTWATKVADCFIEAVFTKTKKERNWEIRRIGDKTIITYKYKVAEEGVMHNIEHKTWV